MNDKKIMCQYYESEIKKIKVIDPSSTILEIKQIEIQRPMKICWGDVFGYIVTAGYLIPFLIPEHWFSFVNFGFSFHVGFLF
jgi:hypothetical protein